MDGIHCQHIAATVVGIEINAQGYLSLRCRREK